jgi:nucleoside-diphosphate-sugar epimerase
MTNSTLEHQDLEHVRAAVGSHWQHLHGRRILITGCTGIIGKWLLASLNHAIRHEGLDTEAVLVSRDPDAFRRAFPGLIDDRHACWIRSDVRELHLPPSLEIHLAIHAATDVVMAPSSTDVLLTCALGTHRVLEQLARTRCQRMLLLSSGAVYGKVPPGLERIEESFVGGVCTTTPDSAYAEGKRFSELLCTLQGQALGMTIPMARCFAMVGPFLPPDRHFAIGNFIDAALNQRPIRVRGDGRPLRSYLYLADVTARLWLLLFQGQAGAYNLGSPEALTILELAMKVKTVLGAPVPIVVENKLAHGVHADRYIPDDRRLREAIALSPDIPLDEAIRRTAAWQMKQATGPMRQAT